MTGSPLYGVVLAGGRSRRMGRDKTRLEVAGGRLLDRLLCELRAVCERVFVSARREQWHSSAEPASGPTNGQLPEIVTLLVDEEAECGPVAGLLAARRFAPQAAWLVLACDMPGADRAMMRALADSRDEQWDAVALSSAAGAEPLFAVWEPAALRAAESAWRSGEYRLRRVLARCSVRLVEPTSPISTENINTPEQWEKYLTRHVCIGEAK